MNNDSDNVLERLGAKRVDFVIVGDFAGVVHGCTHVNQGIEICCDFSPANLLALQRAISQLEPIKALRRR